MRREHWCSSICVCVVLCLCHRAADLGGTPDFEGLLVGSQAVTLLLGCQCLAGPKTGFRRPQRGGFLSVVSILHVFSAVCLPLSASSSPFAGD